MRRYGVRVDGRSLWWPAIARNKRSVAVDLRDARGQDAVRRIAARLRRRARELQARHARAVGHDATPSSPPTNPGVVLVHVSGFGQTGHARPSPGSARSARRWAGSATRPANPTARRRAPGISIGDSLAGLFAVVGTLAALHERTAQRRGQEVDVAIYEAVLALMESTVAD